MNFRAIYDYLSLYKDIDNNGKQFEKLCYSIAGEPYYSIRLCPTMTLGQILSNPDELMRVRAENFTKKGLDLGVVVCYYGDNRPDEIRKLFSLFLPRDIGVDGGVTNSVIRYNDDGAYVNAQGEFSPLYNCMANMIAKDAVFLFSTFKEWEDIARYMIHLSLEFWYGNAKENVPKFIARYDELKEGIAKLAKDGKIDSTKALKYVSDVERAERKTRQWQKGSR